MPSTLYFWDACEPTCTSYCVFHLSEMPFGNGCACSHRWSTAAQLIGEDAWELFEGCQQLGVHSLLVNCLTDGLQACQVDSTFEWRSTNSCRRIL
eukprot:scaffold36526_cov20-Tisochrysis_lutea.AAC.1